MKLSTTELSIKIKKTLKEQIEKLAFQPCVLIIQVGDNPASTRYVRNKIKDCEEVGIKHILQKFEEDTPQEVIQNSIVFANSMNCIHAIFVQLPLPKHMDENEIINTIAPHKDADGLTDINLGKLFSGQKGIKPATARGVMDILDYIGYELEGKKAVVLGRSNLAGKPVATMLMERGATVTICHSKTKDLKEYTQNADIVVSAIGKPKFIDSSYVSSGVVCIDIGINFDGDGLMCGDFDTESVNRVFPSIVTTVPKGTGLTTRTALLKNIYEIAVENNINM